MTDYDKLRELAEKATLGPYHIDSIESGEHGLFIDQDRAETAQLGCGGTEVAGFLTKPNAEYFAAVHPDVILNLLEDLAITRAERDAEKHKNMQMSKDHTTEVLAWDALAEDGRAKAWGEGYEVGCNDGWHDDYKGTTNPYRKDTK